MGIIIIVKIQVSWLKIIFIIKFHVGYGGVYYLHRRSEYCTLLRNEIHDYIHNMHVDIQHITLWGNVLMS